MQRLTSKASILNLSFSICLGFFVDVQGNCWEYREDKSSHSYYVCYLYNYSLPGKSTSEPKIQEETEDTYPYWTCCGMYWEAFSIWVNGSILHWPYFTMLNVPWCFRDVFNTYTSKTFVLAHRSYKVVKTPAPGN